MKKPLIIGVGFILVLAGLGFGGWKFFNRTQPVPPAPVAPVKKKITEPVNVIEVAARPYMLLSPDAGGHYLTINVLDLKKDATSMDFEIEYQSGSLLQGFYGNLAVDKLPAKDTKLFGSKSAGGSITYHEDIRGGNILSRFSGGAETYALKSEWKMISTKEAQGVYTSKDAKFELDTSDLKEHQYIIIFNSPGYPAGLSGKVISEIYSLGAAAPMSGKAQIKIRAKEEGKAVIMSYDGQAWHEYPAQADSSDAKLFGAEVELAQLYVVVAK